MLLLAIGLAMSPVFLDTIVKRTYPLKNGAQVQFLMIHPSKDQQSVKHQLLLQLSSGSQEVVWETKSRSRNGSASILDIDNDHVQLVAARLDGAEFTVLISNVLGIDMLRFKKHGNSWSKLTRAKVIGSEERFKVLDVIAQGIVMTSSEKTRVIAWLDNDGIVRKFISGTGISDEKAQQEADFETRSLIWFGPRNEEKVLAGRLDALHSMKSTRPAGIATEALIWVDDNDSLEKFERLPDPPPPVRVELNKSTN